MVVVFLVVVEVLCYEPAACAFNWFMSLFLFLVLLVLFFKLLCVIVFLVVEVLCYQPAASAGGGQQERQGRGEAGLHPPA
jgi:hypothetical protein